jgi:hypothetical protein
LITRDDAVMTPCIGNKKGHPKVAFEEQNSMSRLTAVVTCFVFYQQYQYVALV